MPQMDALPFANPTNLQILNAVRGVAGSDYQQRVPAATKANIQQTIQAMWEYTPTRNAFIDALVNKIGSQIVRYATWNNPLKKYKRGQLVYGETIEEVAVGLLNAYNYSAEREYLEKDIFGREPNEVQSRFHKLNRRNFYKLTVNEELLRTAFLSEGGVSQFLTALMSQITTSDEWDEFLLMSKLFRTIYDENGFFMVKTPDLLSGSATTDQAKEFLIQSREMADTLPFLSRKYNAAHMPVVVQKDNLELIMTPRGNAVLDVEALAGAFNVESIRASGRITIVPEEYMDIPGCQAILTTKDIFVVADNLMEMRQAQNPVGLHQNYFWHHWQTISVSPFVPAILFTALEESIILSSPTPVIGISALTMIDDTGATVTTAARGGIYEIQGSAIVETGSGANTGLTFTLDNPPSTTRTRITQTGILVVALEERSSSLVIRARATDDNSFTATLTVDLTGPILSGALGATVDDDATTLTNTRLPAITPNTNVTDGTTLAVNNGSWDQQPDSFTYQWQANGTNISGATSDTYDVVSANAGQTITAVVTAHKANFADVSATAKGVAVSA